MDHTTIEECPVGQRELGLRIAVLKTFHIRPIPLSIQRGPLLSCTKCHITVKCLERIWLRSLWSLLTVEPSGSAIRMGGLAAAFAGTIKVARKSNKSGEMRSCKCSGLLRFLRAVRELS